MRVNQLIEIIREDYLDDVEQGYLWSDDSLLRKITQAEVEACNRAKLLFDDSTASYTQIELVAGQASYPFSEKLTSIESIIFGGNVIAKKNKEELDLTVPTWRTDSGMAGMTVYAVVSGRSIRFTPIPDADDAGGIVYLEVYRLPIKSSYNENDTLEIPQEFHYALIYWVLHECYKKQDADTFNQEKSDYYLMRFNQFFGEPVTAKVRQHQFESDKSLMLRPVSTIKSAIEGDDW